MNQLTTESAQETTKDAGRIGLIGAVSVLLTYFISMYLPDMPEFVVGAVITIIIYLLDRFQYHRGSNLKMPI